MSLPDPIVYFSHELETMDSVEFTDIVITAVKSTLLFEGIEWLCEASVIFTGNTGIQELNLQYRGFDKPTDVLSFPIQEGHWKSWDPLEINPENSAVMLGDIVISLERAAEQALELEQSLLREVAFLTVHSVLHLLGYDHENGGQEEEYMCSRQRKVMSLLFGDTESAKTVT